MNSSAWESSVLITGLKPLIQTHACSISSENFILFKCNNFQTKVNNNQLKKLLQKIESDFISIIKINVHKLIE